MCAIFGLIDYNHTLNAKQREKLLRVLSEECEERGTDATGYAFNHNGKLTIYKRPYAAHKVHLHLHDDSMGRTYGYARVSSTEQNLDRQIGALLEYGVEERDIVTDKQSGKDFQRRGYLALKNQMLRPGDTLVIKEMDRLGRDYGAIKDEWLDIQHMGVDIVIIDTPILNTKEKSDLEKNLICSIVFELLAYTAEKERRKIRIRQSEGIRLALDKGVKFGRPETTLPDNYAEVIDLWHSNQITAVEAMKRLDMKKTTFYKLARRLTNK